MLLVHINIQCTRRVYIFQTKKIFKKILQYDKVIIRTGEYQLRVSDSYRSAFYLNLIASIIAVVSATIVVIGDAMTYYKKRKHYRSIGYLIAYSIPLITNNLMLLQFCTIVLIIKRRFQWTNEILEDATITSYSKIFEQSCKIPVIHVRNNPSNKT